MANFAPGFDGGGSSVRQHRRSVRMGSRAARGRRCRRGRANSVVFNSFEDTDAAEQPSAIDRSCFRIITGGSAPRDPARRVKNPPPVARALVAQQLLFAGALSRRRGSAAAGFVKSRAIRSEDV
jgi:hypothetical protein